MVKTKNELMRACESTLSVTTSGCRCERIDMMAKRPVTSFWLWAQLAQSSILLYISGDIQLLTYLRGHKSICMVWQREEVHCKLQNTGAVQWSDFFNSRPCLFAVWAGQIYKSREVNWCCCLASIENKTQRTFWKRNLWFYAGHYQCYTNEKIYRGLHLWKLAQKTSLQVH